MSSQTSAPPLDRPATGAAIAALLAAPAAASAAAPPDEVPVADDPQLAGRSFLAVDHAIIEDVLSDILRAAARRHGVEV